MEVKTLFSKSLAEVMAEHNATVPPSGVYDMGYMNGWGQGAYDLIRAVRNYEVPGSSVTHRSWSGTLQTTEYKVTDGVDAFTVRYKVDSSG